MSAKVAAVRSLTLMEMAVCVSLAGSVAAAFVPTFVSDLRASRMSESLDGLKHIGARATAIAEAGSASQGYYPASVGLTPESVPQSGGMEDVEGTWDHPTWRALEFRFDGPHYYAFAFQSTNKPAGASFVARAHGDLDGDGLYSTFEIRAPTGPRRDPPSVFQTPTVRPDPQDIARSTP